MKRLILPLFISLLFLTNNIVAKDTTFVKRSFHAYSLYMKIAYNIKCKQPKGFNDLITGYPGPSKGVLHYCPILQSKDKDCVVLFTENPVYLLCLLADTEEYEFLCKARWWVNGEIECLLNTTVEDVSKYDFDRHITVLSGKKARKMFNADSVYIYELPLGPHASYIEPDSISIFPTVMDTVLTQTKYTHRIAVTIFRKDRALLHIKLYLTEKGYENRAKFLKRLRKRIWYIDGQWQYDREVQVREENKFANPDNPTMINIRGGFLEEEQE